MATVLVVLEMVKNVAATPWAQQVHFFAKIHAKRAHMLSARWAFFARGGFLFLHVAERLHWHNGKTTEVTQNANNETDKQLNN